MAPASLTIWRIEDFEKHEIPRLEYGHFYSGDSYLVLNTKEKDDVITYDLHMWQGNESSQDEKGACAILCIQLDDELGGIPVQHREVQGYESPLFMGYFKPAIQYKSGGVASGFNHVVPNDYGEIKRLLWVRGRQQVRADEKPFEWASLNKSDCFIIDLGNDIYQWNGPKCNPFERLQTTKVANYIKNNERGGKVKVSHLSNSPSALIRFFGDLDGDIEEGTPEESSRRRGVPVSSARANKVSLHKISDATGDMTTTLISDQLPFKQDMLTSDDVYIVSNANAAQVFIWKGKGATKDERSAAIKSAETFIDSCDELPSHSQICVVAENGETALFKMLFDDWKDVDAQEGLGTVWSINKIAKVARIEFDPSTLLEKPDLAAKYQLPDDGSGDVKIWRIEGSEKAEVDPSTYGQFYGGDCYIIAYSYETKSGRLQHIIYYWIGSEASADEVTALPILTIQTDNEMFNGNAIQVRVTEGHEPPHMLLLFGGKPMIVSLGGTSREGGQTEPAEKRLFHVRTGVLGRSRAVEVPCESKYLNSNDTFLLVSPNGNYMWVGKGATDAEKTSCNETSDTLEAGDLNEITEDEEPDEFWDELNGKSEYHSSPELEEKEVPLRLFECCDASGNFMVEEVVGDFTSEDLDENNVMMLDAWTSLYIWLGESSSENEQNEVQNIAKKYLDLDPSNRSSDITPIIRIKQGNEPMSFTGFFQGWDYDA